MWKTISDWLLAFVNMTRELQENRASIRDFGARLRDLEEAVRLLAQQQRHGRELDAAEREKLVLRLNREVGKLKNVSSVRRAKRKRR